MADARLNRLFAMVSITVANYCPDIYLTFNYAFCQAFVNNNFYTKKQLYW